MLQKLHLGLQHCHQFDKPLYLLLCGEFFCVASTATRFFSDFKDLFFELAHLAPIIRARCDERARSTGLARIAVMVA